MKQFVTDKSLYIHGSTKEILDQLKELSSRFSTVKELLEFYFKNR